MFWILDTNAYSAFKKGRVELTRFLENQVDELGVPEIVLGELYAGFYSGSKTKKNVEELHLFLDKPGIRIMGLSHAVAERYGLIYKDLKRRGKTIPTNDLWIAALCLENGARLITYDSHFEKVSGLITAAP